MHKTLNKMILKLISYSNTIIIFIVFYVKTYIFTIAMSCNFKLFFINYMDNF